MIVRNLSVICQSVLSGSRDRRSPINIDRMMSGRCIEEVSGFVFLHMSKRLSRLHLSDHPGRERVPAAACGLSDLDHRRTVTEIWPMRLDQSHDWNSCSRIDLHPAIKDYSKWIKCYCNKMNRLLTLESDMNVKNIKNWDVCKMS